LSCLSWLAGYPGLTGRLARPGMRETEAGLPLWRHDGGWVQLPTGAGTPEPEGLAGPARAGPR